jgi:Flp pilus assembly protein TadD
MKSKDWNESKYQLEKAIELDPTEPAYYNNLGVLYYQAGDREKAEWHYRQALRFDPAYEPAITNMKQLGN